MAPREQVGRVTSLFGRSGIRADPPKRVVEARGADSRIGRWGSRAMTEAQLKILRKAVAGYQPERREGRTVRLLQFRGLLRTTSFGFPSIVETTDEGRIRLGLRPIHARHPRPLFQVIRGGKS